jgi:hypothetical protein
LFYAEIHEPNLLLVLATKDLSEVLRTNALPFGPEDHHRLFAGFDENGLLSFASSLAGQQPKVAELRSSNKVRPHNSFE